MCGLRVKQKAKNLGFLKAEHPESLIQELNAKAAD